MLAIPLRLSADEYGKLERCSLPVREARLAGILSHAGPIVPNLDEWAAGDIVISRPPRRGNGVDALQRILRPGAVDPSWTHVGVYDGDGFVWDANPTVDVQERSVGDYIVTKRSIRVLRRRGGEADVEVLRRVLCSLATLPYDLPAAVRMMLKLDDGDGAGGIVCSTFVERVYRHAFRYPLFRNVALPLPVDFLNRPDFTTVRVRWLRAGA